VQRLRTGQALLPLEEVIELLRFAGRTREEEHEARQAIEKLTPREIEVLQALAGGLDSQEISERLSISIRTERNHIASILSKLGVHSQLQALVFALRHRVVDPRKSGGRVSGNIGKTTPEFPKTCLVGSSVNNRESDAPTLPLPRRW
jgi:DNA-binding CsgD family transcriptional regulator